MAFWTGGAGPVGAWWTGAAAACAGADIATGSRRPPPPENVSPTEMVSPFVKMRKQGGSCDQEKEVAVVYAEIVSCLSSFSVVELGQPHNAKLYSLNAL